MSQYWDISSIIVQSIPRATPAQQNQDDENNNNEQQSAEGSNTAGQNEGATGVNDNTSDNTSVFLRNNIENRQDHRIYTVDEAGYVSGHKNKLMIRYK